MTADTPPDMTAQRFGENLRTAREHHGFSQAAVAAEMTAVGYPFHQQTIARIESGSQRVRLDEALALARIVRTSIDSLARPAGMARDAYRILDAARRVREARRDVAASAGRLRAATADLERQLRLAAEAGHTEALADEISVGRNALRDDQEAGPPLGRYRSGSNRA